MDNIPEIRIRKGSDAPSLGEQDRSGAPLASFEALSDLESESECGDLHTTTSLNKLNGTSAAAIHDESIDSGVGAGDTSDVNGGLVTSSMEMDVTEAEEVYSPPTPTAVSPPPMFSNGHRDIPEYADNSSSDDNNDGVVDDDNESDDDGLPGDATPTEEGYADAFGYATLDANAEPDYDEHHDQDSEPELDLSLNKAITTGMLESDDFAFSSFDSPLPDEPKPEEASSKSGPARPPPPRRPPPPSGSKAAPPRPKPPRPVSPGHNAQEDKEVSAFNEGAPAKIKITLPKHEMKKNRSKSPRKPPGPRPPPPKMQPATPTPPAPVAAPAAPAAPAGSWTTFDDAAPNAEDDEEFMVQDAQVDLSAHIGEMPTSDQTNFCDNQHEKKHKKGLPKVPKKLKGFMDVSSKKILKSPKKDKRDKDIGEMSKFVSDDKPVDKTSENWKAFEQMNARIQQTMTKTQENIEKLGPEIEETVSSVQIDESASPWGAPMSSEGPHSDTKADPKAGWEGFEDTFEVTPNMELSKKLPHLNVSPMQSPQHNPVPPYNSRRTSLEGSENESEEISRIAPAAPAAAQNVDLLGLNDAQPKDDSETVASITADIMALSRNPQQGDRSSTNPSPVPDGGNAGNLANEFDDFLGLGVAPPSTTATNVVTNDDPFGLGTGSNTAGAETSGDLYLGELEDDSDLFTVPDVDELIAKHAADQEAGIDPIEEKERPSIKKLKGPNAIARPRARSVKKSGATGGLVDFKPPTKKEILATMPKVGEFDPRSENDVIAKPVGDVGDLWDTSAAVSDNPFEVDLFATEQAAMSYVEKNPGTNPFADDSKSKNPFSEDYVETEESEAAPSGSFNPFATISHDDALPGEGDAFDPFATIHDDEALDADMTMKASLDGESGSRINPFDKEPPLDAKYANFEPQAPSETSATPNALSSESSLDEELEPLPPFHMPFTGPGWKLLLRQPTKKKLTGNRFWKPVYVRLGVSKNMPSIRVFNNERDKDHFHELILQPCYSLHNMGLQQYDQYGKCHTLKIQYVFYKERVGVKAERLAPTLGDLVRVRSLVGFKDLVHKPKTTMILDHAPQASELLKFGSLDYNDFLTFFHTLEDTLFNIKASRDNKSQEYTKDEITMDIIDEYVLEIDADGHIGYHKARVRVMCLAFLSGNSFIEVGLNEKSRRGKEIVGRHDIIPIKTEEWIRMEDQEFHSSIDMAEFEKARVLKMHPLDACRFEVMRFRVRPRLNKELPLQIRVQQMQKGRHIEIRSDIIIPGYYTHSRRCAQTPCEDIQIRFPIPEEWIYLFRVEKRFRYGSIHSAKRKPGKIKGLERLTQIAQGIMPPSLIEVTNGIAKYENVFGAVVWRINRLPERNEGAYKQHLFVLRLDLGPHDFMPEEFNKHIHVEYSMPNSTVSRAQIRSISIGNSPCDDPPDRWVHHTAKYNYTVEIEFVDPGKPAFVTATLPEVTADGEKNGDDSDTTLEGGEKLVEDDSSSSSSSSSEDE